MQRSLVSIVVPVYNVEQYLPECLNSLIGQSYEEIEIIAVDDGSTDDSGKICDEYGKNDQRIRVIHRENGGVVSARNDGIYAAKGEYICFVDADDTVNPRIIEHLVKSIGSTDIATCGVTCERRDGTYNELKDAFDEGLYSPQEMDYFLDNMIRFQGKHREGILQYAVAKLYKTKLLQSIAGKLNKKIKYGEDRELVYRAVMKANSIMITHKPLYFYRYRKDSALHGINNHVLHDINYLYETLRGVFSESSQKNTLLRQLEMVISSRIFMTPKFMGFSPRCEAIMYLFPYYNFFHGERVVLYGAGSVGWNYYHQTKHLKDICYVLWVDKKFRSDEVQRVETILTTDYDYILIAVLEEKLAKSIKDELNGMGIPSEKMLWRKPIILYDD
ncbi:MAG: glycosyltransferase [Selenomonadaceae bacterium]|nr:glycosyltransferase [Selenomonadaceae bacterium]